MVKNVAEHRPHLLVFAGDQFYEGSPTRRENSDAPTLDYLYKWYLWVWAFAELTRNIPTIVQTDDHDVYHGNLWGNGGRPAPETMVMRDGAAANVRDPNKGGYRCSGEWVNLVQRTQCGHNPDAFDPRPVEQGITVHYGAFKFGGVSFAILEDRKFKTAPIQGGDLDVHEAELLGARQEKFLEEWGKDWDGVSAKVCLTQTVFACVQTSPTGRAMLDWDSNGHPKLQRDRAIELLKKAKAIVLAGDQHLASVVQHGVNDFADGVVQYTGPAGASGWQRWFEPNAELANARRKHTGDFVDAFGNKVRVMAVANPKVTFAEYRKVHKGRGQGLGDRKLKSEGYGIVVVDKEKKEFVIECWKWDEKRQFVGWPVRVAFA
jgi:alkaline phosphatase D